MNTLYNKLVRDRIPEIIESSGRSCTTEILSKDDYILMQNTIRIKQLRNSLTCWKSLGPWRSRGAAHLRNLKASVQRKLKSVAVSKKGYAS